MANTLRMGSQLVGMAARSARRPQQARAFALAARATPAFAAGAVDARRPLRPAQPTIADCVRARAQAQGHSQIRARAMSSFDQHPAPPRLPPEEQAEFERLVKQAADSAAAAELADAVAKANAEAAAAAESAEAIIDAAERMLRPGAYAAAGATTAATAAAATAAAADGMPSGTSGNPVDGVWRGAAPEFEGDRNPKTGEVGGPKNEPLRWGGKSDWSFNGRVTDF